MSNDDPGLTELAAAILDGTPIDWDVADSHAAPPVRPIVRHLKAIEAMATAHRADTLETWGHLRLLERIGQALAFQQRRRPPIAKAHPDTGQLTQALA